MKILKVSTDMEISAHEFPEGDYYDQNRALRALIGDDCELYQMVYPHRLYTQLHHSNKASRIPGESVFMLVDEEFLLKDNPVLNIVGSYLYGTDEHGSPIAGNVLFVGEVDKDGEVSFCGLSESTFSRLKGQLEYIAADYKKQMRTAGSPQKPENKAPKI